MYGMYGIEKRGKRKEIANGMYGWIAGMAE
jgi:hypothetical protein